MTTESQKAFERFIFDSDLDENCCKSPRTYEFEDMERDWLIWQASEARIRAMLESEEMVRDVAKSIAKELAKVYPEWADPNITPFDKVTAKAALKAIAEGI